MKYREEKDISEQYKQKYLCGIERLIFRLEQEALIKRNKVGPIMVTEKEMFRKRFAELLGWPLTEQSKKNDFNVDRQVIAREKNYIIERVQFTVLEDIVMTGLLFRREEEKKRPFILAQHGGGGTPEAISGMYGATGNYNDMVERLLEYDVNVFAPQLLLWSREEFLLNYDRYTIDARLKNVGSSVTAIEIFAIMQILDYFEKQAWVGNIGMAGLSYGGFYTLYTAALDTRIKAAISCSYFCDATHYVTPDWSWNNIMGSFGEAEIACLVHPRKLFLEMGVRDEMFDHRKSKAEYDRICRICGGSTDDWLEFVIFDGNHEFYRNNEHIEKMVAYLTENKITEDER